MSHYFVLIHSGHNHLLVVSYCFVVFQPGEANGESKPDPGPEEELDKKQHQLEELTEKLENAQRAQKQLFLIVFQVRKYSG